MTRLLLIFVGGGAGAAARYVLAGWVQSALRGSSLAALPVGTLVVNVLGCLLIGLLHPLSLGTQPLRPEYRLALTVGLLGGFTTFSSFAWETTALARDGTFGLAAANVALHTAVGLGVAWLGYRLGLALFGSA